VNIEEQGQGNQRIRGKRTASIVSTILQGEAKASCVKRLKRAGAKEVKPRKTRFQKKEREDGRSVSWGNNHKQTANWWQVKERRKRLFQLALTSALGTGERGKGGSCLFLLGDSLGIERKKNNTERGEKMTKMQKESKKKIGEKAKEMEALCTRRNVKKSRLWGTGGVPPTSVFWKKKRQLCLGRKSAANLIKGGPSVVAELSELH